MKKIISICLMFILIVFFTQCNTTKKTTKTNSVTAPTTPVVVKKSIQYTSDIAPILKASCSPCHFPPDGSKLPLDTYNSVKSNINDIIERVKLPNDARGFMPFMNKKTALTSEQISLLVQWQKAGMP